MYDNNDDKDSNVTPYRASGNLNTSIGIPKIDVYDPMNVNIQNVNTDKNNDNISSDNLNIENTGVQDNDTKENNDDILLNNTTKSSKKNMFFIKIGPKFKIIFLIIVVFLALAFLVPVIISIFNK